MRTTRTASGTPSASPTSRSSQPVANPMPLGTDSQCTIESVGRLCTHARPSPLATVTAPNTPTAAATCSARVRQRAAPYKPTSVTLNSSPNTAVTFTAVARPTASPDATAQPRATRPACTGATRPARRRATCPARAAQTSPATSSPAISASLCAPDTRWMSTSGFARPSQTAAAGSTPHAAASRGRKTASSTTPSSAASRSQATAPSRSPPEPAAAAASTRMANGPYGAGRARQIGGTAASQPQGSASGPAWYGSSPAV